MEILARQIGFGFAPPAASRAWSPPGQAALSLDIVCGREAFAALRDDWNHLFARAGTPQQVFQSHAFLRAWAEVYADQCSRLMAVSVRRDGMLVAVAGLAETRPLGLRALRVMGSPVAQFSDVLVDPSAGPAALEMLWAGIESLGADFLEARRVREDSALWRLGRKSSFVFETLEAPFACLAKRVEGDQPGSAYDARDRSNVRRRLRRLAERGQLALGTAEPGAEAAKLAVEAVRLKRASLKRTGVVAPTVASPRFADFFAAIAMDAESGLRVSTIMLDERPIGIDLSFLCKGTAFGHVLASDPDFTREGIGNLLVHHVFAAARARGAETFDLLAPADAYKLKHADAVTKVESRIYPLTWRGRLASKAIYEHAMPLARWVAHFAASLRRRKPVPAD